MHFSAFAVAIAGAVLAAGEQRAQGFDCRIYANFAARVAEYRDVSAPLPKVLAYIRQATPPGLVLAALEHEARRVYAEGLDPDEARRRAFKRCQDQLGEPWRDL